MSGTGRGTHREVGDWKGTLSEVWDGSGDPPGGQGWVEGPSQRYETGQGTLSKVRDGSGNPPKGPGWVGDPPKCRTRVGDRRGDAGRVGRPSQRSKMGRRTLGEV